MVRSLSNPPADNRRAPIVFAGGGTAGHVFPGIAIAAELDRRIVWIGSSSGLERRLVSEAGIEFHGVPAGKLRRYVSLRNLSDMVKTMAGVAASMRILRRERPALVFSKGGFVSVPPVVAAWLCRIPAWTHESDFDPGLATRINVRMCEKVLVSFPETIAFLPQRYRQKAIFTGNPVRAQLYDPHPERGRA
jgi:UDP-N-acetylglucosamine--N-acetylmuramyl-(pentapeptide) pyrophosphoryl-undecaprenol N-acetylglucosamine transferase